MKLIIGLGNPGIEYEKSRHNFGFMAVDNFADNVKATWEKKPKFHALAAECNDRRGRKIILTKPQAFYNLSGEVARKIRDFYKLTNADILVVHDDMDLPIGTIRTRIGGSDAGNNGIKSLNQYLGADFARIRIGSGAAVAHDVLTKPTTSHRNHVLSRPNTNEEKVLEQLAPNIQQGINDFINGKFTETTHKATKNPDLPTRSERVTEIKVK
jgi:PTH1 family peptidyl-tRNA hydrolase